jgi:Xaa-Pro aminopeptidase
MSLYPFREEEYEERLRNVRNQMSQQELDALIVTGAENIYYVSGFRAAAMGAISPLIAVVVPFKGDPTLITRSLEVKVANDQWMKRPALYMDHVDPFKLLADILTDRGAARGVVGIEEANLTVGRLKKMEQALPGAKFKDASGIIKGLMTRLSRTEIEYIKKAAAITKIGFQQGIETVKEGVFGYEVVAEINHVMYKAGQTDTNTGRAWCWAGPEGGQIHSSALDYRIRKGDLVTIEVGGVYQMYRVNAQGTIYVGENPPEIIVKTYKMISDMYKGARDAVKPGAKAGEVYDGSNKIYHRLMGTDYFRRVGGSMGLTPYTISLSKGGQEILNPGFALVVQPLVNEPFLITCCSTMLVTETGREELTTPLFELKTVRN